MRHADALATINAPRTFPPIRTRWITHVRRRRRVWTLPDGTTITDPHYHYAEDVFVGRLDGDPWRTPWSESLMPTIVSQVGGWCTDAQGEALYRLALDREDGQVVELGTATGRSATWLGWGSRRGAGLPVLCVDTFIGPGGPRGGGAPGGLRSVTSDEYEAAWHENIAYAGLRDTCRVLRSDSVEAARAYAGPPVSLLYVDAEHTYAAARGDLEAWGPLLTPGAIVAFDDCLPRWHGIMRVQRELAAEGERHPRFVELLGRADAMLYWRVDWRRRDA